MAETFARVQWVLCAQDSEQGPRDIVFRGADAEGHTLPVVGCIQRQERLGQGGGDEVTAVGTGLPLG